MIPENEWLPQAQRLAIGMTMRVRHRNEGRANMIIGNERGKWWCYCQRCKAGGVVEKEHVLLGGAAPVGPVQLTLPTDIARVYGSEFEDIVGRFLASKTMMFPYLPELYASKQVRRVLMHDGKHWHGRDLTGKSPAKWLHYGARFSGVPAAVTVLTEDLFSMFKMRFAMRHEFPHVAVCCTLGAGIHDTAVLALKSCSTLVWAYDGDDAGDHGAAQARKRMQVFGMQQHRVRPPQGLDPKDLSCVEIRALIRDLPI